MSIIKYRIATQLFLIILTEFASGLFTVGIPVIYGNELHSPFGIKSQRTLYEGPASRLTETLMENGLRVIIDERSQSATVNCSITVGLGSRYESEGLNGISHLIEHILLREDWWPPYDNEKRVACPERKEVFRQISAAGGVLNGSTTFEYTRYYLTAPASEFETVFKGLSQIVLEPCYNRRGVNLEKKVVFHEIAFTKNNPFAIAYYSFMDRVLPDDPLGRPITGTTLSLKTISFEKITEFYQTYYVPNNMTVVIVGGVDTEVALREVQEIFADQNERPLPEKPFSTPDFNFPESPLNPPFDKGGAGGFGGIRGIRLKTLTKQGFFCLVSQTDGGEDKGKHAMQLLYPILGPGKNSRLYRKLKDEGLSDFFVTVEDFGSQELASLSDIGIWGFVVATRPDKLNRVEEVVRSEIDSMMHTPISEEELSIAKSEVIGRLKTDFESNEFRAAVYTHCSISGGLLSREAFIQEIENISTGQITQAMQDHFREDRCLVLTVMPAKGLGIIWAIIKFLLFKRI